jgi:hypothetical protein
MYIPVHNRRVYTCTYTEYLYGVNNSPPWNCIAICARGNSHKGASVEPHASLFSVLLITIHTTLSVYACCYPTLSHAFFAYASSLRLLIYSTLRLSFNTHTHSRYTQPHFSSLHTQRTPANRRTPYDPSTTTFAFSGQLFAELPLPILHFIYELPAEIRRR